MQKRDESAGEGSLAAEGKSIIVKHLPAAEVLRCAGFLFPLGTLDGLRRKPFCNGRQMKAGGGNSWSFTLRN
jgi:hypothetical protein